MKVHFEGHLLFEAMSQNNPVYHIDRLMHYYDVDALLLYGDPNLPTLCSEFLWDLNKKYFVYIIG